MTSWRRVLILTLPALLSACQSDKSATCSLAGGTQLATAPWPKFRADTANTGRAPVDLTASIGDSVLLFDGACNGTTTQTCIVGLADACPSPQFCVPIGAVSTTPLVGLPTGVAGAPSIYVASSDGNVYVLNPPAHCSDTTTQVCNTDADCPSEQTCIGPLLDAIEVIGAIVGTPLLGADHSLFVPSTGLVSQFRNDGTTRYSATVPGFVTASPNIWDGRFCSDTIDQSCDDDMDCPSGETCEGTADGTVYVPSQGGFFTGVCPNGVPRFGVAFLGTQSTAAIVPNPDFMSPTPITIAAGIGGQVRAYNVRGHQYWSFFASATVVASVLVDQSTDLFYIADTSGRIAAGDLTSGKVDSTFSFATEVVNTGTSPAPRPGIISSPALGNDDASPPKFYVADQGLYPVRGGILYALNRATGDICWTYEADGPITSSPAVATGGSTDVIVFAADVLEVLNPAVGPVAVGGRVYAVPDAECNGERRARTDALWIFDPASIDPPGHSYSIGASSPSIGADGIVYIGREGNRRGSGSECPRGDMCVVNDGGALYAINVPSGS